MPADTPRARITASAVFVVVPALLGAIWLRRTPPAALDCGIESTPARDAVRADWLAGAGPIVAAGALVVLAAIVVIAVARGHGAAHGDHRPGAAALLLAAPVGAFIVAFGAVPSLFAPVWLTWVIAYVFAPLTVPAGALWIAAWVRRWPRGLRALAAIQALGWCSLLVGVAGVAVMIGGAGAGRVYC